MRLIDADALPRHGKRGGLVQWHDIEKAPTVDAVPVRHGKWIIRRECVDGTFFTGCRCSECNYWKPMDIWKYCPNCGAKMGDEHGAD